MAAVVRILTPLVKLLLRHGVAFGTFVDIAKWVYVNVANQDQEFHLPNLKHSLSRVSVVTGIPRKEVTRVIKVPCPEDDALQNKYNRAARAVSGWTRDVDFADGEGRPDSLPLEGAGSFGAAGQ